MSRINWFTIIGILCVLGGIGIASDIWINGAENYDSASRRGGAFEWIIGLMASLIGSKATAIIIAALLSAAGFGIYKVGQLVRK